jgi:hypothetical protein
VHIYSSNNTTERETGVEIALEMAEIIHTGGRYQLIVGRSIVAAPQRKQKANTLTIDIRPG